MHTHGPYVKKCSIILVYSAAFIGLFCESKAVVGPPLPLTLLDPSSLAYVEPLVGQGIFVHRCPDARLPWHVNHSFIRTYILCIHSAD